METKSFFTLILALVCTAASAQVYRCTDPASKKTTYSDAPCMDGKQIVRERNSEEQFMDAQQATLARQRFLQGQENEAMRQQRTAPRQVTAMPSKADSQECKSAKRELSISSNVRTDPNKEMRVNAAIAGVNAACGSNTELIQSRSRSQDGGRRDAPGPKIFTHCNQGFCYDNTGGVYHRNGPDFLTSPNGRTCHRAGAVWNCN
jgi:hypothetical protein